MLEAKTQVVSARTERDQIFRHKEIEIVVYERDETAYLLRSPANREQLLKAIAEIEQNHNLVCS
ncbi:MAG: hypothetical protein QOI77_500 [Blastocatellia bacterium]|jgi:antitoxin YefM|nr:hypothetical protein [Blastocatellia bacterium]